MLVDTSRRQFLTQGLAGVSAAWVSAHWPALVSAAEHAHSQAKSATPEKFEFFTPEQAAEVDAVSARIIPTTDTPGAHEAGVVFFIDRTLVTFAKDNQKAYAEGLPALQAKVRELFPGTEKFSAATPEQQDKILVSLDEHSAGKGRNPFGLAGANSFFETVRVDTVMAFLIDPDSDKKGNRDGVGWKVIGRDSAHMFQPPFGYYDKDYPGWQPNPASPDKPKS
ncbi:MAG TPA: gluconate 2-dehydrogenase subunit 3 family protein [Candidatus Acidoferrum sp.]|nr:gluconate 2-dehydrogenase subunit 3 family protein [Candidatus Acidoferrum sp.]